MKQVQNFFKAQLLAPHFRYFKHQLTKQGVKPLLLIIILIAMISNPQKTFAQYVNVGTASNLGNNCFRLTPQFANSANGAIWYISKIDLTKNVHIDGTLNFGTSDIDGADGMAFVLQTLTNNFGNIGGGLGYQGLTPSIGVEFDTYENTEFFDLIDDHIALVKNGDLNHSSTNNLQGPITLPNLEDGANHTFSFDWDAVNKVFQFRLDGVLRINYTEDIIATIFNGEEKVFWGFTAATGAFTNNQSVCISNTTFVEDPALTWTNNNGDTNWSNGGNWTGGVEPNPNSDVVFNGAAGGDVTIDKDVTVKTFSISSFFNKKVNLGSKTLSIKDRIFMNKFGALKNLSGKIAFKGKTKVNVIDTIHTLEVDSPDGDDITIEEDLVVAKDLKVNNSVGIFSSVFKKITALGNVSFLKALKPNTNTVVKLAGSAPQSLQSAGNTEVEVDKTGGEVTLSSNSFFKKLSLSKGIVNLGSKTLTSPTLALGSGSKLKGIGGIFAAIKGLRGSRIAPGNSPGKITIVGSLEMESESILEYECTSLATDSLLVSGEVSLDGCILEIIATGTPAGNLLLIDNDGTDPIIGTFAGFPEGSNVLISGKQYRISYMGGSGNDVVLLIDLCPQDPNKTEPGICGCGVPDVATVWYADVDGDGYGDINNSLPGYTCIQPQGYVSNNKDACPNNPNKHQADICGCSAANDSDCDGVTDCDDLCAGGDDSGPCNAKVFLGMNSIPAAWKCHSNGKKVYMCHNGKTICVSENAVQAHLNHGDFLGPCSSCSQSLVVENDQSSLLQSDFEPASVFPNPSNGTFTIELNEYQIDKSKITIFDKLGRSVYDIDAAEDTHSVQIDLSHDKYSSGDYFIRISSNTNNSILKFRIIK